MKKTYLNHEQKKIANWLKTVKFRRELIGGVCEQDVWEKIEELNTMYEKALSAERARYDALLAEKTGSDSLTVRKSKPTRVKKEL